MATINGTQTVDGVLVLNTDTDPTTSGGTVAPIGSIALASDGSGMFLKTGAGDTVWTMLGINTQVLPIAASDETTPLTTGTNKTKFRIPYGMTLIGITASLSTAQTSGNILTIDVNKNGTTVLSTKITIDNTETTSVTALTPPVISDSALATNDEIEIDIDQVGDGTAIGLKLNLIVRPTL